ncbi:MAG: hypothetical protein WD077_13935 [Bacteroidia bacterium]
MNFCYAWQRQCTTASPSANIAILSDNEGSGRVLHARLSVYQILLSASLRSE